VDGLNLLAGCPQQCVFCYARAYPGRPEVESFGLYVQTAEQVRAELSERRRRPLAVYLCPSTDPFPPYIEAQVEACRVVEALAEHGVEAWIMTRGFIRPFAMEVLARHHKHVRVTFSITTLDNHLRRATEPLAAPPRLRLKQLRQLRELGIPVQAAIDPLLPGLTDTRTNLEPLVDALAEAGVTHVTAAYMFVRHGIRENLIRELGPLGWDKPLLESYAEGRVLPMGPLAPAQHLPRRERQRGYALLMALAANRGIRVSVSALSNPDFGGTLPRRHEVGRQQRFDRAV
jgi:DNA repair photolyase